jgi:four helix bundle protein
MLVARFEELVAWQKARVLTREMYGATRRRPFAGDIGLASQVRRAAVSVMSNIAEGFERGSRAEFQQFLNVARASCGEVRSALYVAFDVGYLVDKEFDRLQALVGEVSRLTTALWASVARQRRSG